MNYKLIIKIDPEGRQFLLENNQSIILVFASNSDFSVACLSFSPFGDSNEVKFCDDHYLYGTSQNITNFSIIKPNSQIDVNTGDVYIFDGVAFSYDRKAYSNEVYGVSNQSKNNNNLTTGIGQKINISNNDIQATINIASVPKTQTIYFNATTIVRIFVAKGIYPNMILPTDILTPIHSVTSLYYVVQNTQLTIGNYLEIDLKNTTSVEFDLSINAFKR